MPSVRSLDDLLREVSAALGSPAREPALIHGSALEWLALVPLWPEAVAEMGFPGDKGMLSGRAVNDLLRELEQAGWVESTDAETPWPGRVYHMSRAQRRRVIQLARSRERSDPGSLLRESIRVCERVRKASATFATPYPRVLREWCELLQPGPDRRNPDGITVADRLGERVQEALRQAHELGLEGSPDVAVLLDAAEPLSWAVGGAVRGAMARCQRQLELYHRRRQDEAGLDNYQDREELDRSLEQLVTGTTTWALHYVGVGGVGKTMFLRHLQTRLAAKWNLATARVDFDYLNPNYPLWSPGLLLLSFAEELKLEAPDSAIDYFTKLTLEVNSVHGRLEAAQRAGTDVPLGFDAEGFSFCLMLFVEALLAIERAGRRPLLILDTCEELARLRFERGVPRTLIETFRILEAVHVGSPATRVVFSGRRPLARSGQGWSWAGDELPPREYLLLRPILGFDRDEALALLRKYRRDEGGQSLPVPAALHEGILELSRSSQPEELTGLSMDVVPDAVAEAGARCNPYDLALYAGWAAADPTLTPQKLSEAGRHHYVRERIVARLREELKTWLPHLTLLGRFDEELIGEITGLHDDELATLWAEIRRQEWINLDRGAIESTVGDDNAGLTFWSVDRQMRSRLEAYFIDEGVSAWQLARGQVADVLQRITIERDWSLLTPSYFEVSATVLRETPDRAAAWWRDVEGKLIETGAWEWADRIVASLLAPGGPIGPTVRNAPLVHPLDAPVRALRANIQMRSQLDIEALDSTWREVSDSASAYADPRGRAVLQFRAAAGGAAYLRYGSVPLSESYAHEFTGMLERVPRLNAVLEGLGPDPDGRLTRQVYHTAMALLDNSVEVMERVAWSRPPDQDLLELIQATLTWLAEHLSAEQWLAPYSERLSLLESAAAAGGRFRRLAFMEDWSRELNWTAAMPATLASPAFDWLPPKHPEARRLLELGRLLEATSVSPRSAEFLSAATGSAQRLRSLDDDRLLSQALRLSGEFPTTQGAEWIFTSIRLAGQREECQAHRRVPPLYVTVIQLLAAGGLINEALEVLQQARGGHPPNEVLRWLNSVAATLNERFRLAEPVRPEIEVPELPIRSEGARLVAEFMAITAGNLANAKEGRLSPEDWEREEKVARLVASSRGFQLPIRVDGLEATPSGWRPWFARYLVIRILTQPEVSELERGQINAYLIALYGSELPGDVAFLAGAVPAAPRPKRDWGAVVVGFVMIAATGYGLFRLTGWVAHVVFYTWLPWWQVLFVLVVILSTAGWIGILLPRMTRLYLRILGRFLPIATATVSLEPDRSYSAESSSGLPRHFRWPIRKADRVVSLRGPLDPELAYLDARRALDKGWTKAPAGLLDRWMKWVNSLTRLRHDIALTGTDPQVARPCWESMFGTWPGSASPFSQCPFEFRRTTGTPWEAGTPFVGQMSLVSVSAQRELGTWRAFVSGRRGLLGICDRTMPDEPDRSVGLLMLQAEASISEAGIRLATDSSSRAFRPDDVARLFPNLRLLVLLGFDRSEAAPRSATDRVLAGQARMAAYELCRVAAPAVICIPGLPSRTALTDEALEIIAKVVARRPGNVMQPLRSAVRRIQDRVFAVCGLQPEDASELAYDICYFSADRVNMSIDLRAREWQPSRGERA